MASRPSECIAAIATAPGRGGIGVVRISGPNLSPLAAALGGREPQARIAQFARFRDGSGGLIDEGLLLYFPAPHSFTGEDVIELQGHGGPVVMQMLLARCLDLGARLAEPGEFTRRAFLNGKLDLAQAESVADLIEASTAAAARSAVRSLTGSFSREVQGLCERLIDLRMLVEATLDFPDEDVDFLIEAKAFERIEVVAAELRAILDRARQGSLLRNGLHVVLVGQPNVGKSSLLNRLAGEERAIVTDIAGTTRDALRETIQIEGIPLHIIDTAGLRDTTDEVERIGIARTWQEIERADVVVRLVDVRAGLTDADANTLARGIGIPETSVPKARAVLETLGGMDVSREALPFMAFAEGALAGVPARAYRISFSGELSYEIAVPAARGLEFWDACLAAGAAQGAQPYGTEALHVMRAEKGFIMIGDETDGTVIPQDLNLGWAVSKKKSDFIGKRAQARADLTRPDRETLVGLLTENPMEVLPDGAYAVAEPVAAEGPTRTIGHVTSSYFSPTLGHSIAMALIEGGAGRLGQTLDFPVGAGGVIRARVVDPVFLDKEGSRQDV